MATRTALLDVRTDCNRHTITPNASRYRRDETRRDGTRGNPAPARTQRERELAASVSRSIRCRSYTGRPMRCSCLSRGHAAANIGRAVDDGATTRNRSARRFAARERCDWGARMRRLRCDVCERFPRPAWGGDGKTSQKFVTLCTSSKEELTLALRDAHV